MTTKLTLSIDEKVVERAKQVSRKKGKSLSKIVEEYLSAFSQQEDQKVSIVDRISAHMKGKIKTDLPDDYKEFIRQGRYEDEMKRQRESNQ